MMPLVASRLALGAEVAPVVGELFMLNSHESVFEIPLTEESRRTMVGNHLILSILNHPVVELLRHPLIILLLGAVITFGLGEYIRSSYQTRQAKGNFSLRVVQLSFNRLFWTRLYIERTRLQLPKEDLDNAWREYIKSVEAWNTDLVSNIELFNRYYPNENKRLTFETEIHPKFREFNQALIALRYQDNPPDLDELDKQIDEFNATLYRFIKELDMEFIK